MQKSSVEPEIFKTFQHKVERVPHFACVSEVRHIYISTKWQRVGVLPVEGSQTHWSSDEPRAGALSPMGDHLD